MAFMNATNVRNTHGSNSSMLEYVNSTVGKTFPLMNSNGDGPDLSLQVNALLTSQGFGEYLSGLDIGEPYNVSTSNTTAGATSPLYTNPLNITAENFTDASKSTPSLE
jgi:hypothetical protein